jgi:hypothetical protein
MSDARSAQPRIPSVRISPDNVTVVQELGLLGELAGHWHGKGFNLVARPDFQDQANLFLELNLTSETLTFTRSPRRSPIAVLPSRTSHCSA